MIANKIKYLLQLRKLSQEELAVEIGMTRNGLNQALSNDDFKTSTLLKIAKVLEVEPEVLFKPVPENGDISIKRSQVAINSYNNELVGNNPAVLKKEIEHLKKLLEEKEKQIRLYELLLKSEEGVDLGKKGFIV